MEGDCLCLVMTKRLAKKKTSTLIHVGSFQKNKLEIQDLDVPEKIVSFEVTLMSNSSHIKCMNLKV